MLSMVIFIESRPFFVKKRSRRYCRLNEKIAYRICGILIIPGGKGLHNRKREAKGPGPGQGFTLLLDCG